MAYMHDVAFRKKVAKDTAKSRMDCLKIHTKTHISRLDMGTGLSGIVRVVRKGTERRGFEIQQDFRSLKLKLIGFELNDTDIGILLAVILIAQRHYCKNQNILKKWKDVVEVIPDGEEDNEALDKFVIKFETMFPAIFEILGLTDGKENYEQIRDSLHRIATITVRWQNQITNKGGVAHLITGTWDGNKLNLVLSYRLVEALLANINKKVSYAAIEMSVFNSLPRGAATVAYIWIASWYGGDYGKREIREEKLVGHVYGLTEKQVEKLPKNELKKKKWVCRQAMIAINEKSAYKNQLGDGKFFIERKSTQMFAN